MLWFTAEKLPEIISVIVAQKLKLKSFFFSVALVNSCFRDRLLLFRLQVGATPSYLEFFFFAVCMWGKTCITALLLLNKTLRLRLGRIKTEIQFFAMWTKNCQVENTCRSWIFILPRLKHVKRSMFSCMTN